MCDLQQSLLGEKKSEIAKPPASFILHSTQTHAAPSEDTQ